MNADIKGALQQINKSWRAFQHKGKPLTKKQVIGILNYGVLKGYRHTGQFTDEEIDNLLNAQRQKTKPRNRRKFY